MHLPFPHFQPIPPAEPAEKERAVIREDVLWDRPVFKAPPLELHLQSFNAALFAEDLRRIGLGQR